MTFKIRHKKYKPLQFSVVRITRTTYAFIGLYLLEVIIFDSWNLISHDSVSKRWTAAGILLAINTIVWYVARTKQSQQVYKLMVMSLVISEIILAGYTIYWERGMAGISTLLFAVPIVTAGVLKSRATLIVAATFCAVAYSTAAVLYFNEHYGEGYRVQLWGQVVFFGGLFFIIAWLLMVLMGIRKDSE